MSTVHNRVRAGFYLDSVALMRLSQTITARSGVVEAALMIGTPANRAILDDAGLLVADGRAAGPNDLILALRAADHAAAEAALDAADALLDRPAAGSGGGARWRPRTLAAAIDALDGANLALISVPGAFAAGEARMALARGLNVMIFSDNVAVADERALKAEAAERGLLVMGPDCGTALIGGVPLAFANAVPRGDIGLIAASGTGLQEVSCLIARAGGGVSHGIGVGGRDLGQAVGGLSTLAAIDLLDADPATRHVVLISKPPAAGVADKVIDRIARASKSFTVCLIGAETLALPANTRFAATLADAAADALGGAPVAAPPAATLARARASRGDGRRWIHGLYTGGTLAAEAQVILRAAGVSVASNAPIPGADTLEGGRDGGHRILDLGADEYTVGRPHPMIEPNVRVPELARSLADPSVAVVLVDVVLGFGAHPDPAGAVAAAVAAAPASRPAVVASVCGTDGDPQNLAAQIARLESADIIVAGANARAVEAAIVIARG